MPYARVVTAGNNNAACDYDGGDVSMIFWGGVASCLIYTHKVQAAHGDLAVVCRNLLVSCCVDVVMPLVVDRP